MEIVLLVRDQRVHGYGNGGLVCELLAHTKHIYIRVN